MAEPKDLAARLDSEHDLAGRPGSALRSLGLGKYEAAFRENEIGR